MRLTIVGLLLILSSSTGLSQGFWSPKDSLHTGRTIAISSGIGATWSGSMIGLNQLWYANVEKAPFHTFDDSRNWMQMDKVGHFYTAYKLNHLTSGMYRWAGIKNSTATWIGAGISVGFQTTLEVFDGYSAAWGFSWYDVIGNTLGTAAYTAQYLIWEEERIVPKFSYSPTEFAAVRPSILGSSFAESLLKDYNGQTYWLSFSPGTFFPKSNIPKWACLSIGYSTHAKLVGDQDYYLDGFSGQEYFAEREWVFSLDIDFSKFDIKRPWLKVIVSQFNYLKVPFPAIYLRGGQLRGSLLYF